MVVQEPPKLRTRRMLGLLTAGVERRLWVTDAYFLSVAILILSLMMSTAHDGVDVLVPATNDLPWIEMLSRTGYCSARATHASSPGLSRLWAARTGGSAWCAPCGRGGRSACRRSPQGP